MILSKNKKIGIRAIEESDLGTIQKWRNDSTIRRYFREHRELSLFQKNNWYQKMILSPCFEMFVIEDIELKNNFDDEPTIVGVAGITYIDWLNRHGDVHFYIGKNSAWIDKKYSPEAIYLILNYGFNVLNLNKLYAEVYEIDKKKLKFFKKMGFKVDASLREHYFFEGKYYTSHILSLLKGEYH